MLARRTVLRLAAGAAALPAASQMAGAQDHPKQQPSAQSIAPLAERLAAYADRLRLRISMLRPMSGSRRTLSIQSDVASAPSTRHRSIFAVTSRLRSAVMPPSSVPIGVRHLSSRPSPMAPLSATSTSTTPMSDASPFTPAITLRPASRWQSPSGQAPGT
jgi:hypothetical protein